MLSSERSEYQKAYVELYELIKKLSKDEKDKIPNAFLKNLKDNMDSEYKFKIDDKKSILDQEYKIETKALFVELYEKHLASNEEKEFWNRYDKICFNMIETEKKKRYDTKNIFGNKNLVDEQTKAKKEPNSTNLPIEIQKNTIWQKFIQAIKRIFF